MEKEINEGDTRHPAALGQSHSLQIFPNEIENPLTFGDDFVHAANPAGLGCIPLRAPCPTLPPLYPCKETVLHPPSASVQGAWRVLHPWGISRSGDSWGACDTLSSYCE